MSLHGYGVHKCPAPNCHEIVDDSRYACGPHYHMLPFTIKDALKKPGTRKREARMEAHRYWRKVIG